MSVSMDDYYFKSLTCVLFDAVGQVLRCLRKPNYRWYRKPLPTSQLNITSSLQHIHNINMPIYNIFCQVRRLYAVSLTYSQFQRKAAILRYTIQWQQLINSAFYCPDLHPLNVSIEEMQHEDPIPFKSHISYHPFAETFSARTDTQELWFL